MSYKLGLPVLLLVASLFNVATSTGSDRIGLYLDPDGTLTCMPDSSTYPISLTAYLIAESISDTTGISGWEASVQWDSTLYVTLRSLSGSAMNMDSFPQFQVGLGAPLPYAPRILLATFRVLALDAGGLYLKSYRAPSLPGLDYPVYASGSDPTHLTPLALSYGAPDLPCLVIGSSACPAPNDPSDTFVWTSSFTELETREDGIYGKYGADKTWVKLPSRPPGEPSTEEEEALTAGVLRLLPAASVDKQNKSFEFYESFFTCTPEASEPFYDWFYGYPLWYTEDLDSFIPESQYLWGITNTQFYNDAPSAYCSLYNITCTAPNYCDTTLVASYKHGAPMLAQLWPASHIDLQGGSSHFLTFTMLADFSEYNNERLHVLYWNETNATLTLVTTFSQDTNEEWRGAAIPTPYADYDQEWRPVFEFSAPYNNYESEDGVYIDDIVVYKNEADLTISSLLTNGTSYDASVPVRITITVYNNSIDPSMHAVTLGMVRERDLPYWPDPSFEYDAAYTIPTMDGHSSYTLECDVYCDNTAKSVDKGYISRAINFYIDTEDVEKEADEWNNTASIEANWTLPNPPVVLVHGLMGGALGKADGLATPATKVWGDAASCFQSLVDYGRIERAYTSDGTGIEADYRSMYTPDPYPPDNGFIRSMGGTVFLNPLACIGCGWYSLFPGVVVPAPITLWQPIIDELSDNGYALYPNGAAGQIYLFNYDWRLDMDPEKEFFGRQPTVARLDSLITHIYEHDLGGDRLVVVTHSAGSNLLQTYLMWKQSKGEPSRVNKWLALGAPLQGSLEGVSSLFGHNPLIQTGRGLISEWLADMVQDVAEEYASMWQLLPTPAYDANAPTYDDWRGPGIYAQRADQPYPLRRISLPIWPEEIKGCNYLEPKWSDPANYYYNQEWATNAYSRLAWSVYKQGYLPSYERTVLNNVPLVKLISCGNIATLAGIVRYEQPVLPVADSTYPGVSVTIPAECVYHTKYDVFFGRGDGTVPEYSATHIAHGANANVAVLYCDRISHRNLVNDGAIAEYIAAEVLDQPSLNEYSVSSDSNMFWDDTSRTWYIAWYTDCAFWCPSSKTEFGEAAELPVNPITLELYDRTNSTLLCGVSEWSDVEGGIAATPITWCYDERIRVIYPGRQVILYSDAQEEMHLRLIVRASPELWYPWANNPAKMFSLTSDKFVEVMGHLNICEAGPNEFNWAFPPPEDGARLIEFHALAYDDTTPGFQAYVDFTIQQGQVLDNELRLYVDGDGDGSVDVMVTGVVDERDKRGGAYVVATPNPCNGGTAISWGGINDGVEGAWIYDLRGRLVCALRRGDDAGAELQWDARDGSGRVVPSGTYSVLLRRSDGVMVGRTQVAVVK